MKANDLPKGFPDVSDKIDIFDEFFDSGMEESISPFLTRDSRKWGKNLHLKASSIAAFLLICSFLFPVSSPIFLLFTYFFAGIPALIASVEDTLNFEINIDVLMTLAAFLSVLIGSGAEGALLLVLFSFSHAMDDAVRTKAKGAISAIKKVAPTKAFVIGHEGVLIERSVKDIRPHTLIFVKAGEIVPLDGKVVKGASSVNLVHLTGENAPVLKKEGDQVAAGSRNLEGSLTIEVLRTSSDSTIAQIIKLIMQAQSAKPKLERLLDKISSKYAMTIIGLSILIALSFPFLLSLDFLGKQGSIYRALSFLIAASPCALIIAVPIAYLSAVSVCARKGILLKGGIVLDALATCKAIALDKTGTLTEGELTLLKIQKVTTGDSDGYSDLAFQLAYTLERNVIHPIAKAIINEAEEKKIPPLTITDFTSHPGYGLEANYDGKKVFIGNKDFIFPKLNNKEVVEEKVRLENTPYTLLLYEDKVFIFRFKDRLRADVKKTLVALKQKWKLRLLMLTGDHYESAKVIANEADIDEFYADLRPDQKLNIIDTLAKKENLAMVGDGINDAPSLARATVGISMGKKGSATAVDASDIVLLNDNIEHLEWLFNKGYATKKIVYQNLFFALLAILAATIPAIFGWIPLWTAVLVHEGGTVAVGLNALRLLGKK